MKIIGINCSHRRASNSEALLDCLFERLSDDFACEKVNVLDLKIDCLGCESCFVDYEHHKDDLAKLYENMLGSDVIVFSSPTYFGMPSGLGKVVMDRSSRIWLDRGFKGKLGAVIVNGASTFGAIELNAKNIAHFCYDHEMITVPFFACFNNSFSYPDEKFPLPLAPELVAPLEKLAGDIRQNAAMIFRSIAQG